MEKNEAFEFTYSAPVQDEVKKIRDKYLPREEVEDKLALLRRLDNNVSQKATVASLVIGVVSCLVMGVGMCCCLVWTNWFILGIVVGVIGMAGMALAYPVYQKVLHKERARVAPQILKLTEELMR